MSERRRLIENYKGEVSSTRLMSLTSLMIAIIFGFLTLRSSLRPLKPGQSSDHSTGLQITIGFLIAAFAPKTLQKFAEQQVQSHDSEL